MFKRRRDRAAARTVVPVSARSAQRAGVGSMLPAETDDPLDPAWRRAFEAWERIVLVANSDAVERAALEAMGEGTLFVFFNRVFKVLDAPFERPSVLLTRCSNVGPNLVHRGEQHRVLPLVAAGSFGGVLMLRAAAHEVYGPDDPFSPHRVARLNLSDWFEGAYPPASVPTSGFALAAWLASVAPDAEIVLAGFSARRSDRWKLFDDHDWTFEQTVLRVLERGGRLRRLGEPARAWPLATLMERYPGLDAVDAAVVGEVLAERLRGTNLLVDRIWSMLKPLRALDGAFRSLKPRTRRERIVARRQRDGERGGG